MSIQKLFVTLALFLAASAIHLNQNHDGPVDLPAGNVQLVSDLGTYLKVCHNCG
jgi:hypothetical protein